MRKSLQLAERVDSENILVDTLDSAPLRGAVSVEIAARKCDERPGVAVPLDIFHKLLVENPLLS